MQKIVYLLFLIVLLIEFLDRYNFVPHAMTLLPELLSGVMLVFVALWAAKTKMVSIGFWYWIVFILFAMEILFGLIANAVPTGAIFSGARVYFKFIPFFFLPVVYRFSENDLKKQLILLMALVILQLPVSVYQRFIEGAGMKTGDVVRGTLTTGGHQSIFLFCAIAVLLAFYIRKHIKKSAFILLFLLFLAPATLNETKASIFLLPVAVIPVLLAMEGGKERIRAFAMVGVAGAAFLAVFLAAYDHFYVLDDNRRFDNAFQALDFFSEEGRFNAYLAPSATLGSDYKMGKIDKVLIPLKILSDDPVQLMFGLGMGNMTNSVFGSQLEGEYTDKYAIYAGATLPTLLWEVGVLGAILSIVLLLMILKDALYVSHSRDLNGVLALGWVGVMALIALSFLYRNILQSNGIGYLVTYFSGYIVASRVRMEYRQIQ